MRYRIFYKFNNYLRGSPLDTTFYLYHQWIYQHPCMSKWHLQCLNIREIFQCYHIDIQISNNRSFLFITLKNNEILFFPPKKTLLPLVIKFYRWECYIQIPIGVRYFHLTDSRKGEDDHCYVFPLGGQENSLSLTQAISSKTS